MPSGPQIRSLVLALVLVFAGCTMPFSSQSGTPRTPGTESPTLSPDTTTSPHSSTQTPLAAQSPSETSQQNLPPGVTTAGLENVSALLTAHLDSLRTTGYRLDQIGADSQMEYVATRNYSSYRIIPGPTSSNPAVWANETLTLAKLTRNDRTVYQRPPRLWAGPGQMTGTETLRALFDAGQYTVNGTRACGDRHCTVLTATESPRFQNFTARALVHQSGVVHQFHATYTQSSQDQTETIEYHLILTQLGNVTVSRPPWIETAVANT